MESFSRSDDVVRRHQIYLFERYERETRLLQELQCRRNKHSSQQSRSSSSSSSSSVHDETKNNAFKSDSIYDGINDLEDNENVDADDEEDMRVFLEDAVTYASEVMKERLRDRLVWQVMRFILFY